MKFEIITLFLIFSFTTFSAVSQDTSQNQRLKEEYTYPIKSNHKKYKPAIKHHIYRDTRLGGSSPYFNTYQKNDYGAGAITTDPNKSNGIAKYPGDHFDSSKLSSKIYRDTRLGGSSPHHRTYKTNDYGAGAITTDPHKGNSSGASTPEVIYSVPDSSGK